MKRLVSAFILVFFLFACGGHAPKPVSVYQYGDDRKSCEMLMGEIVQIEKEIDAKYRHRDDKIGRNAAIGVLGGLFCLPVLFALDTKSDELFEIDALLERRQNLRTIVIDQGCYQKVKDNRDFLVEIGREPLDNKKEIKTITEAGYKRIEKEPKILTSNYANNQDSQDITTRNDNISLILILDDDRIRKTVNGTHGYLIKKYPVNIINYALSEELESSGYHITNNAPIEYRVKVEKCDLDYVLGAGMPMTALIELSVKIKSIKKDLITEKEYFEKFSKVVSTDPKISEAERILNECVDKIVKKISSDEMFTLTMRNYAK